MFPPAGVMQQVVNAALGGMIKSVEHVVATIPDDASTTFVDVALTKGQSVSQCVAFCSAYGTSATNLYPDNAMYSAVVFDDGGTPTLRVQRVSVDRGGMVIYAEVVEFQPVINVYRYTVNNTGATNPDISITTVDPDYSFIYYRPRSNYTSADDSYLSIYPEFLSGSSIRVYKGGYKQGYLYVIEDSTGGSHFSVSHYQDTISASNASKDTTITSVDWGKTFFFYGIKQSEVSWYKCRQQPWVQDIDSTTIRATRGEAHTSTVDLIYQVIVLNNGTVEHGDYTMPSSEDQKTITLTSSVDITEATPINPSLGTMNANHIYTASVGLDFLEYAHYLNGAGTTITAQASDVGNPPAGTNRQMHWQVVTWA